MKYCVRLRNYRGSIQDGASYEAPSASEAEFMYISRCIRLGISYAPKAGDYITVQPYEEVEREAIRCAT